MKELLGFLISMSPIVELRGSIPYMISMGISPLKAYLIAVIGNILPVPFILLVLYKLREFLVKIPFVGKIILWWEKRAEKKKDLAEKWGYIGLALFVAIPIPGSGAWTGSFVSFLLNMDIKKSILAIFVGVLVAGFIVLVSTIGIVNIFTFLKSL